MHWRQLCAQWFKFRISVFFPSSSLAIQTDLPQENWACVGFRLDHIYLLPHPRSRKKYLLRGKALLSRGCRLMSAEGVSPATSCWACRWPWWCVGPLVCDRILVTTETASGVKHWFVREGFLVDKYYSLGISEIPFQSDHESAAIVIYEWHIEPNIRMTNGPDRTVHACLWGLLYRGAVLVSASLSSYTSKPFAFAFQHMCGIYSSDGYDEHLCWFFRTASTCRKLRV